MAEKTSGRPARIQVILYALVGVALIVCLYLALRPAKEPEIGLVAVIQVDGQEVKRLDLDEAEDQEFTILEESGKNITFQVKSHAIRFLHSDCPDKVCVNAGFLNADGGIASCLPNRTVLTVSLEKTGA